MQCLRGGRAFAPAPPEPSADELELYPRLLAAELDPMLAQALVQGTPFEELFEVDAVSYTHLTPPQFTEMMQQVRAIAAAVGRTA